MLQRHLEKLDKCSRKSALNFAFKLKQFDKTLLGIRKNKIGSFKKCVVKSNKCDVPGTY